MNKFKKLLCLKFEMQFLTVLILSIFFSTIEIDILKGQNLSNYNWIFGSNGGNITFNYTSKEASYSDLFGATGTYGSKQSLTAVHGSTGTLLFYSDGTSIFNANNVMMPTGNGINGLNTKNYAVSGLQSPFNENHFLVFHADASDVSMTLVDINATGSMSSNAPMLGDVVSANKNSIISNTVASDLILPLYGKNSDKIYVLFQDTNDNMVYVFSINRQYQFASATTLQLDFTISCADSFEATNNTLKLALGPKDQLKKVSLIDFNLETGQFVSTSRVNIDDTGINNGSTEYAIYSLSFSSTGKNLYISIHGNSDVIYSGNVLKYDIAGKSIIPTFSNSIYRSFGLKLGPDDKIYHIYQSVQGQDIKIGVFNNPEGTGNDFKYQPDTYSGEMVSGTVFPYTIDSSFTPPVASSYGIDTVGNCQNKTVALAPTYPSTHIPTSINWDFGDGNMSTSHSPTHTYATAGTFDVKATLKFSNGETREVTKQVTIDADQNAIKLPDDTTLCSGETLTLDAGSSNAIWNTGVTGSSIVVSQPGTYYAVVGSGGCISYDEIKVKYYQNENKVSNQWVFGTRAGIDFNQNPPSATSTSAITSPIGGTATISDENGIMLFYTDGETVWTKEHTPMPNGTAIGGQKGSTQSSLIIPFPKDNTLFYIFTTQQVYGNGTYHLSYSIVDLKQNGLKGDVVLKNKLLLVKSTERIAANTVGDVTWLVAHEYGNNIFNSYKITENGISSAVKSNIGLVHSSDDATKGKGYMKLNNKSDKLAITIPGNTGKVQVFNFDNATGRLTNVQTLDTGVSLPTYPYGLEWSKDSRKLFVSILGTMTIQEWELVGAPSKITDFTSNSNVGALQMGPNGNIYVAKVNATTLDTLTPTESTSSGSTFTSEAITLSPSTTGGEGLPSFIQSLSSSPNEASMSYSQTCANSPTIFKSESPSEIDTYTWDFGDNITSNEQNPMHTYAQAGTYNVRLSITNKCGYIKLLTETVVIETPPNITDESIGLCGTGQTIEAGQNLPSGLTYIWTLPNGNTLSTSSISVSTPGAYTVAVTTAAGCTKTVTKNVIDIRPSLELGADKTVCKDSILILDAENTNARSYVWKRNNVVLTGETTRTLSVDTSVISTVGVSTQYEVTVEIVVNNSTCTKTDTINVTVIELPSISIANKNETTACGVNNGSLEFTIGIANSRFTYKLNDGTNDVSQMTNLPSGSTNPITINNLSSGSYTLTIINETTNCEYIERHIDINDSGSFKATPQLPINFTSCRVAKGQNVIVFDMTTSSNNKLDEYDSIWVGGEQGAEGFQTKIVDNKGKELKLGVDYFQEAKPRNSMFEIHGLLKGKYSITFTSPKTTLETTTTVVNNVSQNVVTTPNRPSECTYTVNVDITNTASQLDIVAFSTLDNNTANAVACGTIPLSVKFSDDSEVSSDLFSFEWSSETAQFKGAQNFKSVGAVSEGEHTYKVKVSERNGNRCPNEDDIIATILKPLEFTIQEGSNNNSCDGQLVLSAAITNGIAGEQFLYEWIDLKNNNAVVGSVQTLTVDISSNLAEKEYSYQLNIKSNLRSSSCITPVTKTITLQPKFVLTVLNTLSCDDGSTFEIIANTNRPSTAVLKYNWKKDGQPFPQSTKAIVVKDAGEYEVEVLELKNLSDDVPICRQSAKVNVTLAAIPKINIPTEVTICPLSIDTAENQLVIDQQIPTGYSSYRWIKDGVELSTQRNITISGGEAGGIYKLEATTIFGCISRAEMTVVVNCKPEVYAPTAFTPNKNGINEAFSIKSIYVTDFTISVFNKWGETIFKSNDINFAWDGSYNNEIIPSGAYSYVMEYQGKYDKTKQVYSKQGGVMVLY